MTDLEYKPTELDLAWAGGFFDGEGSIAIGRSKSKGGENRTDVFSLIVSVCNTDKEVVEHFQKIMGFGNIYAVHRETEQYTASFTWQVGFRQADRFLSIIYPYLIHKRKQADIARKFYTTGQRGESYKITPEILDERISLKDELSREKGKFNKRVKMPKSIGA